MKNSIYESERIYWLYTTSETERDYSIDTWFNEQVPYCEHWQTVRQVSNGYEPTVVLGDQRQTMQNPLGLACLLSVCEGPQRTIQCDSCVGYCRAEQLFI